MALNIQMNDMRRLMLLCEAHQGRYRVFHGSPNPNIREFRLRDLHHRTGTPGTLSFTTSLETAKIYGSYIYEVEVNGKFGDYDDPADVETNFAFRWPQRERDLTHRYPEHQQWCIRFKKPPQTLDEWLTEVAAKDRKRITDGRYEMWELVPLWRDAGWDGAWCIESGSRNLLVGNIDCVTMIGLVKA